MGQNLGFNISIFDVFRFDNYQQLYIVFWIILTLKVTEKLNHNREILKQSTRAHREREK